MAVPGQMLNFRLDAPDMVEFDPKRATTRIVIRSSVHNTDEEADFVMHSSSASPCSFWHLLDENHKEVQRSAAARPGMKTQTVAAGHGSHESIRLAIDTKRLVSGRTYTVRCVVWNQTAETTFVALEKASGRGAGKSTGRRKKPKKASRKAAAKRKPAAKKARKKPSKKRAAKKPAKKKATKKRVARKPAKKKATKKRVARKPAKKKATKKRAARKPAKKKATKKRAARKPARKKAAKKQA